MEIVNSKLKVAVLAGGVSEERDISLESGRCVAEALKQAGLKVVVADIGPDNLDILDDKSIDVFFIALHGIFGEDGQLQQIIEDKSLIYTGSGSEASRLAFDKSTAKQYFTKAGVATPSAIEFDCDADLTHLEKKLDELADKFVVKPVCQGSTIGVTITTDAKSAIDAAGKCSGQFGRCMIERFIPGREVTVGILEDKALPVIEVKTKTGFYDYHAKYIDAQTEYLFDTITEVAVEANIKSAALDCFEALGCRHFARVDFILSEEQIAYALELNTIPGFTTHSLLPRAAAKTGLSMSDLCVKIVESALKDKDSLTEKDKDISRYAIRDISGQKKTEKTKEQKSLI